MGMRGQLAEAKGWRRLLPVLLRLRIAKSASGAGQAIGEWVSPEWPEIDRLILEARSPEDERRVLQEIRDFIVQPEN